MSMAVVDIGIVRVTVQQWRMDVKVRVRFMPVVSALMRVLVVRVMRMRVTVRERFVAVRMRVMLAEVQCYAGGHEQCGDPERSANRLVQQCHCQRRATEGRQ